MQTLAIFAHPGHELRPLSTLQHYRADVAFLTDASASTGQSRIELSRNGLQAIGLQVTGDEITCTDAELYTLILNRDEVGIRNIFMLVCQLLQKTKAELIITDAAEGYNPAHDFCHFLVKYAAQKERPSARVMGTPLTDNPLKLAGAAREDCLIHTLDEAGQKLKTAALTAYARSAGGMLGQEARDMERRYGPQVHKCEILRPALTASAYLQQYEKNKPYFEVHGEKRVEERKYGQVIRLQPHLAFALQVLSKMAT